MRTQRKVQFAAHSIPPPPPPPSLGDEQPIMEEEEEEEDIRNGLSKSDFFAKYLIDSKIIGQGSFAVVRRCQRVSDDTVMAMKIIKKKSIEKSEDMELIRREISILMELDHPNIIRVHSWCETSSRLFIVLDYCGGGNVLDRIIQKGSFSEFETAQLIKELAVTIRYYHSKGVVHRDLKPENIMYLDPSYSQMKLIDFGMANSLSHPKALELSTACGSPLYAAPEILNHEKYGTAVDIWSMGVITYLLLCGFPPFFDTQNIKNVYALIRRAKFSFPSPFWDNISDDAKDFICCCLELEVEERFTAEDVLQHQWIDDKTQTTENDSLYDDDADFSSSEEEEDDSNDEDDDINADDVDYDEMLAQDVQTAADFNVNPLHKVEKAKNAQTPLKRAKTERTLNLKQKNGRKRASDIELKRKGHGRKASLLYMNEGTIFSAQRDHLQKQKILIDAEREELNEEIAKMDEQRNELTKLLDEANDLKKKWANFEREQKIFTEERKKWLTAKGSVDDEKQRLQKLQQTMTERYEAEFDKFVMETQEQRNQLRAEVKKLTDERLEFETKSKALNAERRQFEMDRNNALPTDLQALRQELESEWLQIAKQRKQMNSEKQKLQKLMNTIAKKEKEIDEDQEEIAVIKEKMSQLEKAKIAQLELLQSDEFETLQKAQLIQGQRELDELIHKFESDKQEFEQLKADFYDETLGDDEEKMEWKKKYLIMKNDFDSYCDEMDEYCDGLELKCKNAENKYHDLYSSFDAENAQLTLSITEKEERIKEQAHKLKEFEQMAKEFGIFRQDLDEKQKKFDRQNEEMSQLHEQISNYKAQCAHFVEIEAELNELKKQFWAIQKKGGTAVMSTEYADDVQSLTLDQNAAILPNVASENTTPHPEDENVAIKQLKVGDRVELQRGWMGKVQYIGSVPPIKHEVIGLALDEAIPDGHDGKGLFVCKPKCGYFTQRWRIKRVINDSLNVNIAMDRHPSSIRIKVTNIDQNDAVIAEEEEDNFVMIDYTKSSHNAYIEPSVPRNLDTEQLGMILHKMQQTPIYNLDQNGNDSITLQQFVSYFEATQNVKNNGTHQGVYEYAFKLIDTDNDGHISPLEYYRFFDQFRLFPSDHFVHGAVEYKVSAIKSYGLCAEPLHSHIFADDSSVYLHKSQFKFLKQIEKLQFRDDTSDEDAPIYLQSDDDDTESLYDEFEAQQSAVNALKIQTNDAPSISSSDSLPGPGSFEGGLFNAYVQSGHTPQHSVNQTSPFPTTATKHQYVPTLNDSHHQINVSQLKKETLPVLDDTHVTVEDEEDTISFGVSTPNLFNKTFFDDDAVQKLNDRISRLQQILKEHQIPIPSDLVAAGNNNNKLTVIPDDADCDDFVFEEKAQQQNNENEQEREERERQERRSKIKLKNIESRISQHNIKKEDYSFGIQCFFEQYDVDKFGCITFGGFVESLKILELDETPESELRAIWYWADKDGNNGLDINEYLYALCAQFLNSILDRKLR